MNHYLVVFDRPASKILARREYTDRTEALQARFDAEREYRRSPEVEVVVLGGESWASLRRTHGRYFRQIREFIADAVREVSPA